MNVCSSPANRHIASTLCMHARPRAKLWCNYRQSSVCQDGKNTENPSIPITHYQWVVVNREAWREPRLQEAFYIENWVSKCYLFFFFNASLYTLFLPGASKQNLAMGVIATGSRALCWISPECFAVSQLKAKLHFHLPCPQWWRQGPAVSHAWSHCHTQQELGHLSY